MIRERGQKAWSKRMYALLSEDWKVTDQINHANPVACRLQRSIMISPFSSDLKSYFRWIRWSNAFFRGTETRWVVCWMREWRDATTTVTYLLFPRSRSSKPSVCLWKSNTSHTTHHTTVKRMPRVVPKCARSDINKRCDQLFTPRDSFFSISSTNSGRFTTQPLPMQTSSWERSNPSIGTPTDNIHTVLQVKAWGKHMKVVFNSLDHDTMPGIVASLRAAMEEKVEGLAALLDIDKPRPLPTPVNRQVCLYPKETRLSTSRYSSLRLTSSPHWAPRTMATIDGLGNGCTVTLSRRLAVEGREAAIRQAYYLENWNRSFGKVFLMN